jgi:membrane dipeptidase
VRLQCFALFTDLHQASKKAPLTTLLKQLSCFRTLLQHSDGRLAQVRSYRELCKNQSKGIISALLTLEESGLTECPPSLLPFLYNEGVRITTLTWNYPNVLGHPCVPPKENKLGLTPLGFDFIAEAERLGILLDVSHLSDTGFFQLAAHTKRPFLASHSNARAVCNVPRNLTDRQLRLLADRGGIVGVNLHLPFLGVSSQHPEDILSAFVRHVLHIRRVAGSDTPAFGSDFDGIPANPAIPQVSLLPRLAHALKKAGCSADFCDKLFSGNALRLFQETL